MAAAGYAINGGAHPGPRATPAAMPVSTAPPGTFAPGTKVQVGSHRVVIEKYLSEGGFAHVYVVRVPKEGGKHEVAVLKRVAVPDKDALASMRTEVETMKKLQGHTRIVRYIDSHASQLKGGGYEVFLLMEYCAGGGLIDFMNTRLQYRLTEPEILHIISDVAEGVATMHYLKPPLLHRDLKVENVLISKPPSASSNVLYKLCDFGSTAPPRPAATNAKEARLIEDDVQRHTTMQYRSPEMIDVWRKHPIDEKSDIWALGVLLYKLCYYTTPFEEAGQMAILNAKFKFPHHPSFPPRTRRLISAMLKEDPKQRPNIFQVVEEICNMRNIPVPIKNIYSNRTKSEARRNQTLPPTSPEVASPPPAIGISQASPEKTKETLPDITPMRRGRPTLPTQQSQSAKPSLSPAPVKGDPFAALDSSNVNVRASAVDRLSKKFPSLEEFSIAADKTADFEFGDEKRPVATAKAKELGGLVANQARAAPVKPKAEDSEASAIPAQAVSAQVRSKPLPAQPRSARSHYVSTGTMTADASAGSASKTSTRPIWRVPDSSEAEERFKKPHTASNTVEARSSLLTERLSRPSQQTEASMEAPAISATLSPDSSRRDASEADGLLSLRKTQSAPKSRPVSSSFARSNLDYLRDHEISTSQSPPALGSRRSSRQNMSGAVTPGEQAPIKNDTAYLKSLEDSDDMWEVEQLNKMSLKDKRKSMSPAKFDEDDVAFFDSDVAVNKSSNWQDSNGSSRSQGQRVQRPLSPVAASEAASDGPQPQLTGREGDVSADMRRELERQRALQEEKRVADAAEAYRQRSGGARTAPARSNTIQQRMQSLLDDGRQSPVKKTAAGYGHYTDVETTDEPAPRKAMPVTTKVISPINYSRKPDSQPSSPRPQQDLTVHKLRSIPARTTGTASAPAQADRRASLKPPTRPKPAGLRSGFTGPRSATGTSPTTEWQSAATSSSQGSRLAALLAKDQEGAAEAGSSSASSKRNGLVLSGDGDEPQLQQVLASVPDEMPLESGDAADWQMEFSKRYPSLSGIELVETEISRSAPRDIRIRDV